MEIVILGSGTGIPSARRGAPGFLVKIDKDYILLDSGPGSLRQLVRAGHVTHEIGWLCYTHLHPDHTLDLIDFLFSAKYEAKPNPNLTENTLKFIDEGGKGSHRTKPLHLIGPKGFKDFYGQLTKFYSQWVDDISYKISIKEVEHSDLKFRTEHHSFWHLKTIDVVHSEHSVAYRLELPGGKSVVYSGDTNYCKNIVKIAQGADLLILECSFPGNIYLQGHLNSILAARVAKEARVKKLVLTHLYPVCDDYDLIREVKSAWPECDVVIAEDLMTIKI